MNSVSLGGNKMRECSDVIDVDEEEEEEEVVLEADCSTEFDVKKAQSNRPC